MTATLPRGFSVRLDDKAFLLEDGAVLVGGSPLTALRITDPTLAFRDRRALTVADHRTARLADRLLATNLGVPDLATAQLPAAESLTVVVPVRDRAAQLDRCLATLAGLACVVVDDASDDARTVGDVARRHGAALVRLDRNVGPAGARNAGLALVETPYVAFVDSDVEVPPEVLLHLLRHFADPAVALVGPRVVGRTTRRRARWFERYESRDSSLTLGTTSASVRPGAAVAWLPSACLVGRTEALGAGFDPAMRIGEDVDLVWRLTDEGRRVRYDAGVEARHDTRPSVRAWLARKAFYGSGGAALAARHGDRVAPAVLTPTLAVAAAAVLVRRRAALPLGLLSLALGHRQVSDVLPPGPAASWTAAHLAVRGLGWAVRQESALLLRHWWPATLVVAVLSRRMRAALLTALAVDLVVTVRETEDLPWRDLPGHLAARRLDDLAYGAGLWCGAVRRRDLHVLRPRLVRRDARRGRSGQS